MVLRAAAFGFAALALLGSGVSADEPLYSFDSSPLVQLDDSNFDQLVLKDDRYLWVVEFYADWCGHCKQFAKGYEKAATNLEGLVKFGALNADTQKKTARAVGVQGFPSVKLYVPGTGKKNPYTGKFFKPAVDYNGPRSARGVVDFATATLPSLVVPVTDKTLSDFKANGTESSLPKALLFTKKETTTALLKSLSLSLNGRMLLGEARETAKKTAAEFGVTDYPTLVVLPGGDAASPIAYDGELKPAALTAFLETHALETPIVQASSGGEGGGSASSDGDAVTAITSANVKDVDSERDAWILLFAGSESADLPAPGLAGLAEALHGQVKVGKASADLAAKFGVEVGAAPQLAVWPYRKAGTKRKATTFAGTEDGVAAAKKAALDTLPDEFVTQVNSGNADRWMQEVMQGTEAQAFAILFSDKPVVPPLFRALGITFDGKLGMGMASTSDRGMAERFQVTKAPALFVMFPDESKKDEKGNVPLAGMKFEPQQHGKFNYGNIANFLDGISNMRLQQLGKGGGGGGAGSGGGGGGEGGAPRERKSKDLGPPPELTASNFEVECVAKGGLCGIALLDGAPANAASQETSLAMLGKLRSRKAGGPISFSWIDATCHSSFAAAFEMSEMDLPAMIFLSPQKLRWARSVGGFDVESLSSFGNKVAAGRASTNSLSTLPPLEDVDCSTVPRGADAAVEEEDGADDIMAEILEEERKAREEREAALAAEGVDAAAAAASDSGSKKKKSDMSKLELLESEVEECEAMDLLCAARREKQMKAVDKQRDLEAKLKKIAKKKKKAKKAAAKK